MKNDFNFKKTKTPNIFGKTKTKLKPLKTNEMMKTAAGLAVTAMGVVLVGKAIDAIN